jgi:signal peptidase II
VTPDDAPVAGATSVPPAPGSTAPARPRTVALFAAVAVAAFALDVVSKLIVVAELPEHPMKRVRVLGGVFYLQQVRNSGAAFSLGTGYTIILTAVALVVAGVIIRAAKRMRSAGWAVALGLVLGGALGNLADRLFRHPGPGRGWVVDWISLFGPDGVHWPIFNLADSAIVCGALTAAVLAVRGIDLDGRSARRG